MLCLLVQEEKRGYERHTWSPRVLALGSDL